MPSEPTETSDDLDDLGYAEAVEELEAILAELDGDEVDVDVLAERVRRAADLVQLCRRRLDAARVEVTRIVADLEAVAPLDGATDVDGGTGEADSDGPGGLFAAEG
jgi:exodeoxyribonuclease VII small subunit